ncbi:polysaccharide export protein [Synechococcus sp. AH-601-J22]|nr:polysaccharide export protein [Synechococcus sp. AH-601-J22]
MYKASFIWAIASGAVLTLQPTMVDAQGLLNAKEIVTHQVDPLQLERRTQVTYDAYFLGPGDSIRIEVIDIPELGGIFPIRPNGTIYLPRIRELYVENLTIEELRTLLIQQFGKFAIEPEVYVTLTRYRSVRVYVGGEVARPGYYTINAPQSVDKLSRSPKLFDALKAAKGVTPFSQLNKVQVIRKRPQSQGGGKIRANVNFLRLITEGDENVNIKLYDNDGIFIERSKSVFRDQLLAASRTNLSPDFLKVFVSGRVKEPGLQQLPQGASLNQAIASAGGPKLLRGRVEFLRFNREGSTDRRVFAFKPKAPAGDQRNPVLMSGDVIRVNESIMSASLEVINEITAPALGIYSVYSIFEGF